MEVVYSYPPNIKRIREVLTPPDHAVFTYDKKLYCPTEDALIPRHLMAHEEVHVDQQDLLGVDRWWELYLTDPQFRIAQELSAYRAQYQDFCMYQTNHMKQYGFLLELAKWLSGPMYGNAISFANACMMIRNEKEDGS